MGEEDEQPVVGQIYKGSTVVNINVERSTRPNGVIRVRRFIQLQNGMILLEDEFEDKRVIEGEYKELAYQEIPSPKGIKLSVDKEKKKKKIRSLPLDTSHKDKKGVDPLADEKRRAEEMVKKEMEEAARKRELQEAQELAVKREAERAAQKEAEEKARQEEERKRREEDERRRQQEEEELRRRQEEEQKQREEEEEKRRQAEEEARLESERKKRQLEEERLRASQEATRKRKEEADRRREEQRKAKEAERRRAAIKDKWQPKTVTVYSPASAAPIKDAAPEAIWSYGSAGEPDKDFDWWSPQNVIVLPPGKSLPAENSNQKGSAPHGLWAYAPGAEPGDDDNDWSPKASADSTPTIILFPPGVVPSAADGELKVQGEWMYPPGETNFPPVPTPKNTWKPKSVKVHPKSNPPDKSAKEDSVHGVWMVHDGNGVAPLGDDDWRVADLKVYPTGQEPKDISDTKIQGVWGLAPGAIAYEDGDWDAKDLWFFGPGNAPDNDEDWNPQGIWVHSPETDRQDWPPIAEPQDEWKPMAIWVYPPSKLPDDDDEEWKPTGVWNFADKSPAEAEDWNPYQVTVYPAGSEPENLEDFKLYGVWGLSPGAERDDDGNWKASDIWFIGPGDKPPEDWRPQGVWTVSAGNDEEAEPWPPTSKTAATIIQEPKHACVHVPSKAPGHGQSDTLHGIWVFGNGLNDDVDWMPQNVLIHDAKTEPKNLGESSIHGVWGYAPGAIADKDGIYKPSDMWFFLPGEQPDEDCDWTPGGTWTVPPGETIVPFKDAKKKKPRQQKTRQAVMPSTEEPKLACVYPPSAAPDDSKSDMPHGIWAFGNGQQDDDMDWMPQNVVLHDAKTVPKNLDESSPHGVWGYAPGATPDDDGHYKPSDMWFFLPGETPDDDCEWTPGGTWTVPPGETKGPFGEEEWKKTKSPQSSEEPKVACVHPPSAVPTNSNAEMPHGIWAFGNGRLADDDDMDWMPQNVLLHDSKSEPKHLDDSTPHGVWGYGPGAEPDDEGNYDPSAMWFFLPGETPADDCDWTPGGIWTIPPGEVKVPFPSPPKNADKTKSSPTTKSAGAPRKAVVYPRKKAPKDTESGVCKGVWSYAPGKKVMDSGKKPMEVNLYETGQEPADLPSRHGIWGYAPGAQPNADGDYSPEDVWLFAPGEKPPPDSEWQPQGIWADPPQPIQHDSKDKASKRLSSKNDNATKKQPPKKRERAYEKSVWVYPSKEVAPAKGEHKNPQGCWTKLPGGSEDDGPQEILIYTKGHEPRELDKLPHGTWGYAPGSTPDENGIWSPKDMLFFPPGEDAPPDLQNPGVWTYPNGSRSEVTYNYRWEGDEIIYMVETKIFYMDTVVTFSKEYKK